MKILITGGGGFIGTNLVEAFSKKGFDVTIFDNFSRETSVKNRAFIKKNYPDAKII
jgi:nucleoside-diphosphate-sugar epimerase